MTKAMTMEQIGERFVRARIETKSMQPDDAAFAEVASELPVWELQSDDVERELADRVRQLDATAASQSKLQAVTSWDGVSRYVLAAPGARPHLVLKLFPNVSLGLREAGATALLSGFALQGLHPPTVQALVRIVRGTTTKYGLIIAAAAELDLGTLLGRLPNLVSAERETAFADLGNRVAILGRALAELYGLGSSHQQVPLLVKEAAAEWWSARVSMLGRLLSKDEQSRLAHIVQTLSALYLTTRIAAGPALGAASPASVSVDLQQQRAVPLESSTVWDHADIAGKGLAPAGMDAARLCESLAVQYGQVLRRDQHAELQSRLLDAYVGASGTPREDLEPVVWLYRLEMDMLALEHARGRDQQMRSAELLRQNLDRVVLPTQTQQPLIPVLSHLLHHRPVELAESEADLDDSCKNLVEVQQQAMKFRAGRVTRTDLSATLAKVLSPDRGALLMDSIVKAIEMPVRDEAGLALAFLKSWVPFLSKPLVQLHGQLSSHASIEQIMKCLKDYTGALQAMKSQFRGAFLENFVGRSRGTCPECHRRHVRMLTTPFGLGEGESELSLGCMSCGQLEVARLLEPAAQQARARWRV